MSIHLNRCIVESKSTALWRRSHNSKNTRILILHYKWIFIYHLNRKMYDTMVIRITNVLMNFKLFRIDP